MEDSPISTGASSKTLVRTIVQIPQQSIAVRLKPLDSKSTIKDKKAAHNAERVIDNWGTEVVIWKVLEGCRETIKAIVEAWNRILGTDLSRFFKISTRLFFKYILLN